MNRSYKRLQQFSNNGLIRIDLGCGARKKGPNYIGLDIINHPGVDICEDALSFISDLPDDCIDKIYTSHFLEHVDSLQDYIKQIERVLKPGGTLEIIVPHFSNPYYYSDHTHRAPFGLYSMSYFALDKILKRRCPTYGHNPLLTLEHVALEFKSPKPFYFRYAIKWAITKIVNLSNFNKELYEDIFSWIIPCYQIFFLLKKIDD